MEYLTNSIAYGDLFVIGAGIIGAMPNMLRPIIGRLVRIPIRYTTWKIKQAFKPLYKQCMELIKTPQSEENMDPQDHVHMMFRFAQAERPEELCLNDMTERVALANFGAFHQTGIAITNIIFNILGSDAQYNTILKLREEVETVLAASNGKWTKAAIAQMVRADSVCRETLRINSFGGRSIIRSVMTDGVKTEDGILLPKGSLVSCLSYSAQTDDTVFEDPFVFDPFRFSRIREADPAANVSLVSTGPTFLPFGHGRHACPGRFLLDFELKMIIAHLVMNYDLDLPVEYGGVRPKSEWLAEAILPPTQGKIRVRRRKNV